MYGGGEDHRCKQCERRSLTVHSCLVLITASNRVQNTEPETFKNEALLSEIYYNLRLSK